MVARFRSQKRYWLSALLIGAVVCSALAAYAPFAWRDWVTNRYSPYISTLDTALDASHDERVAIVFGARVYSSGRLSAMLRDRVDTAVALYHAGKVDKILVSGDNSTPEYNEPAAMMAHAVAQGVPAQDVQPDYGGRRTYDTCFRAGAIFQVDEAILVTQEFHLPRAVFICRSLGMQATGVIADQRTYDPRSIRYSETREVPALVVALVDVIRRSPPPILGDPIPLN